jgi:hypothetical protein
MYRRLFSRSVVGEMGRRDGGSLRVVFERGIGERMALFS